MIATAGIITGNMRRLDGDAAAFIGRASITDNTQKNAINTFVITLKNGSIWNKFFAMYPYMGGNAAAHSKNLKADQYNITWNGTSTHNANGVASNGTTGYGACSGLTPAVHGHLVGFAAYVKTGDATSNFERMMGSFNVGGDYYFLDRCNFPGFQAERGFCGGDGTGVNNGSGSTPGTGLFQIERTSNTAIAFYTNGTQSNSNNLFDTGVSSTREVYVLGVNGAGTASDLTTATFSFMSVHAGMTSAEVTIFWNAVQALQTALGRQV